MLETSITLDTYSGRQYDKYGPPTYRGSYGTRKFKLVFPAGHEILDFKCQTRGPDGYITHIGVGSSRVPTWNSDMGRLLLETAPGHLAGHKRIDIEARLVSFRGLYRAHMPDMSL